MGDLMTQLDPPTLHGFRLERPSDGWMSTCQDHKKHESSAKQAVRILGNGTRHRQDVEGPNEARVENKILESTTSG